MHYISLLIVMGTCVLADCAQKDVIAPSSQTILESLIPYSFDLDKALYQDIGVEHPPYAAVFKKGSRTLLYLGTKHDTGLISPTFRWIRSVFENFQPDFVIIEGIQSDNGLSPSGLKTHIEKTCLPHWRCSEVHYAAYLAFQNYLPFQGGEPSDEALNNALSQAGYTDRDILFFQFTTTLPQSARTLKLLSLKDLPTLFSAYLNVHAPSRKRDLTFSVYSQWLKAHIQGG